MCKDILIKSHCKIKDAVAGLLSQEDITKDMIKLLQNILIINNMDMDTEKCCQPKRIDGGKI